MTVASDNSVASIFRPVSGPRTQADTDRKEGPGSFGMMLNRTNQADAPAPRADRAPARTSHHDESGRAESRAQDSRDARKARNSADSKRTSDAKDASDVKAEARSEARSEAKSDTKSEKADATAAANSDAKNSEAKNSEAKSAVQSAAKSGASADAANAQQTGGSQDGQNPDSVPTLDANAVPDAQMPVVLPAQAPADLNALKAAAAAASETAGESVAAAEIPSEDTTSTADTAPATEKSDDTGAAVAVPVAADASQMIPAVMVATDVALPNGAPVAEPAAAEGGADAIASAKAANTQGTAPAPEAPKDVTAASNTNPPAAKPATASETEASAQSGAKSEAKPETKPETGIEAGIEAKPETKAEAKSEAKTEAGTEAKAEAKTEAKSEAKAEAGAELKLASTQAKAAAGDALEPAIKFSNGQNDGAQAQPESTEAHRSEKHPAAVNREIAADGTAKAADTALAAAKAGIDSVQNLNASTPAQPTAPTLHVNAATAAAAGAATANNMASNAVPIDGVAVEIATQSQNGKSSFEIRLDPKELGRIDVRLEMDKDGHVTAKMMVDRPETLDLLKRDASNIERALQQAGLKTSDNAMEFSLRDQNFGNNSRNDDNGSNAKTARLVLPDDNGMPLEAVRNNYGRLLGSGRGLDIRI